MVVGFTGSLVANVTESCSVFILVSSSEVCMHLTVEEELEGREALDSVILADVLVLFFLNVAEEHVLILVSRSILGIYRLELIARRATSHAKVNNDSRILFDVGRELIVGSDHVKLVVNWWFHGVGSSTAAAHSSHHLL